ncbi:MAG: iron-sulfur cluster repair di-iron protein [Bacteroidia bacterium]|nr:iron-sulfur cluster repair di-iron protein [Bacteroidia bacterium]
MNITENNIVGELVAEDYRTAAIFKSKKIDFCCNGNRSISEVCKSKDLDASALIEELKQVTRDQDEPLFDFRSWPADFLADYIEKRHHRYVESKISEIMPYLDKVVKVHGQHHPELVEIQEQFSSAAGELAAHMKKEELILFPYIRNLVAAEQKGERLPNPHFGTVENPVAMMKEEHNVEGERFRRIAELSSNYIAPEEACNTYRVTFALLKEFEADLHLHIHLENNILFPKAIEMEKTRPHERTEVF